MSKYVAGFDIGTTLSAAGLTDGTRTERVTLGSEGASIPTVAYLGEDDLLVVGEVAEHRAAQDPTRVARGFKRRVGDPTPVIIKGSPFAAQLLMGRVLTQAIATVTEREGGPPSAIAVTHPANWGPYRVDILEQVVGGAAPCDHFLMTEPEAAAVYYAALERLEPGRLVAVYDLGGGTFDIAILRKTGDGYEFVGPPQGEEQLGGIDFDAAILEWAIDALGIDPDASSDDPAFISAMGDLRERCVRAKVALSSDVATTIPVFLPGRSDQLRLTRDQFEGLIRPSVKLTIDAVERALVSAHVRADELDRVLLVGGSSRIPLVSELLATHLGRPVAVDVDPKAPVCLGAALVAWSRFGASVGPPPVGPTPAEVEAAAEIVEPITAPDVEPITAPIVPPTPPPPTPPPAGPPPAAPPPAAPPPTPPPAAPPAAGPKRRVPRAAVVGVLAVLVVVAVVAAVIAVTSGGSGGGSTSSRSTTTTTAGTGPAGGQGPADADAEPIRLGLIRGTGTTAEAYAAGVATAATYANKERRGVAGRPLEIATCDADSATAAATCVQTLAQQGATAVMNGMVLVPGTAPMIDAAARLGNVPVVGGVPASFDDLALTGSHYFFGGDLVALAAVTRFALADPPRTPLLVVRDADPSFDAPVDLALTQPLGRAGVTPAMVSVSPADSDLAASITQALGSQSGGAQPNLVVVYVRGTLCTPVMNALTSLGLQDRAVFPIVCGDRKILDASDGGGVGVSIAFSSAPQTLGAPETVGRQYGGIDKDAVVYDKAVGDYGSGTRTKFGSLGFADLMDVRELLLDAGGSTSVSDVLADGNARNAFLSTSFTCGRFPSLPAVCNGDTYIVRLTPAHRVEAFGPPVNGIDLVQPAGG
jgi:hypothetical protein